MRLDAIEGAQITSRGARAPYPPILRSFSPGSATFLSRHSSGAGFDLKPKRRALLAEPTFP